MEPNKPAHANGHNLHQGRRVTPESLSRISTPLTVAHGYVQLVQRRLRTGTMVDQDDLLRTLDEVDTALQALRAELQVLDATVIRYQRPVDEP